MTKKDLRRELLKREEELTLKQNGRLESTQKIIDKMYNTLKKSEYDQIKSFLKIEGRIDEITDMLENYQNKR
jgi:hypothetical protein